MKDPAMRDDTDYLPQPNIAIYDGGFRELAEALGRPVEEPRKAFLGRERKGVGRREDGSASAGRGSTREV